MKKILKQMVTIIMAVAVTVTCISPLEVKATGSYTAVENINFTDFSNWRSGMYHWTTGKYVSYKSRVCLNDYVTMLNTRYEVYSSNNSYHVLIRQLDSSMAFLKSSDLRSGQNFIPLNNAKYLGISIYKADGETSVTYDTIKQDFDAGLRIGIRAVTEEQTDSVTGTDNSVSTDVQTTEKQYAKAEDIDFDDFSNWRSGMYHWTTGKYTTYNTRVCLNDYVTMGNSKYTVYSSDTAYHVLIRQLDSDKKFLKSSDLKNDQEFTPLNNTQYLAISIYRASGEKNLSYDKIKEAFANGLSIGIKVSDTEIEESVSVTDSKANSNTLLAVKKETDEQTKEQQFKDMVYQLLVTGNTDEQTISEYGYDWQKVSELFHSVADNEGRVAYGSCFNMYYSTTKKNNIIQTIKLENIDSGYVDRYRALQAIVDDIKQQSVGMSNLEKVILAHDYVAKNCTYSTSGNLTYTAAGALVNGKALCAGYARAMILLLQEMGIESEMITNSTHAWVVLKLNGNWYHADPTWDNTRSKKNGEVSHEFLLRTDAEFQNAKSNRHTGWEGTISTDTTYSNWKVHDVIGDLNRDNSGQWYYMNNGIKTIIDIEP